MIASWLKRLSLETIFVILFGLFSLIYIVAIPPGWNVDEGNHVYRIFQLAGGDLYAEKVTTRGTNIKAYGGPVPTNLVKLFDKTGANQPGWIGDPNNRVAPGWYKPSSGVYGLKDDKQRTIYNFSGSALYSPVTYIIVLPIVFLAKLVNLPFFWIIILCRIADAAVVAVAFYLSIKYLPVGKWIFFAIGLLPSVVIQAATMGADAPQLAATILFILLIARSVYYPKTLAWWHYGLFFLLSADIALIKFAYAPVLLLIFALPFTQPLYRQRKTVLLLTATVITALIPSLVWAHAVAYIDINSNPLANYSVQEHFILRYPHVYARTLYYTYFTNLQQPLDNLFGSYLPLPALYTYIGSGLLVLSLFVKDRTATLKTEVMRRWRQALVIVFALTGLAITTALYIYSNPVHQSSIISIQSRYFLPILPMLLLALYGNSLKNQRVVKLSIITLNIVLLIGTSLVVYHRLYQTVPAIIKV